MDLNRCPQANPQIVLREEFDDWAVLFDPDSGEAFTLNPVGVFIWKSMDGQTPLQSVLEKLNTRFDQVSVQAAGDLETFLTDLEQHGLLIFHS